MNNGTLPDNWFRKTQYRILRMTAFHQVMFFRSLTLRLHRVATAEETAMKVSLLPEDGYRKTKYRLLGMTSNYQAMFFRCTPAWRSRVRCSATSASIIYKRNIIRIAKTSVPGFTLSILELDTWSNAKETAQLVAGIKPIPNKLRN